MIMLIMIAICKDIDSVLGTCALESKVINCQLEKPTFGEENHSVTCECYGDHSNVTLGKNEPIFCKLRPELTEKITIVKFKSCKFWTIEKVFLDPGFNNIKEVNFQGYL